jgi:hypothetical protein
VMGCGICSWIRFGVICTVRVLEDLGPRTQSRGIGIGTTTSDMDR